MLSDILLWNKIGRIVTLLAKRLESTKKKLLTFSTHPRPTNACMIHPHCYTHLATYIS